MVCAPFQPVRRALGVTFPVVGAKNAAGAWVRRGVVGIVCRSSGRVYLEGTNNVEHCYRNHTRSLANGQHRDAGLQADYIQFGPRAFTFELLEFVLSTDSLLEATKRQQVKYAGRIYNPDHRPRSK